MAEINWKHEFSVNIPKLDKQHKTLLSMVNELSDAIDQEQSDSITGEIVSRLSLYAITHFSDEERFMERYGFTELPSHREEHATFVEQIETFKEQLLCDQSILARDVLIYLMNWFMHHIMSVDQKYAEFFTEKQMLHGVS
jgi:hemerythrin